MEAPIQILCREIIKPSSPTPPHLKNIKLSYLDQSIPPVYSNIIFFYQADESNGLTCANQNLVSHRLKQSLSDVLTSFYPLAGVVEDNSLVDCNDGGVEFIEARGRAHLANVILEKNSEALKWYVPLDHNKKALLAVKFTSFECGGVSIGICFSHKFVDCASGMTFVNAWATTCRGETDFVKFNFNLADHFPPKDGLHKLYEVLPLNEQNLVSRKILFNEDALMVLKKEATSPLVVNPTKVEVVSAFIWKHVIEEAKRRSSCTEMILPIFHAVNLRTRSHSLENTFGNCFMHSRTFYKTNSIDIPPSYQDLVSKLRSSITKINVDYIGKSQTGDCFLNELQEFSSMIAKGEMIELCSFISSWCKFPIYEMNYGWGNPVWACTTASVIPLRNTTIMMDTKCGQGIEAWICMEEDEHESLEIKLKSTYL